MKGNGRAKSSSETKRRLAQIEREQAAIVPMLIALVMREGRVRLSLQELQATQTMELSSTMHDGNVTITVTRRGDDTEEPGQPTAA